MVNNVLSIVWLDCLCMVLSCMDGTNIVIFCPKHGSAHIRDSLLEAENKQWVRA